MPLLAVVLIPKKPFSVRLRKLTDLTVELQVDGSSWLGHLQIRVNYAGYGGGLTF